MALHIYMAVILRFKSRKLCSLKKNPNVQNIAIAQIHVYIQIYISLVQYILINVELGNKEYAAHSSLGIPPYTSRYMLKLCSL